MSFIHSGISLDYLSVGLVMLDMNVASLRLLKIHPRKKMFSQLWIFFVSN